MSSGIPKAVLYYFPTSIWSASVLLAFEEKGYAPEEYDLKIVDLAKGENYDPTFLRLNPKATVPTLIVPLSNTLSEEVDSRYKAITESTAINEFLDKSRSGLSKTHTTSVAPAPALTPATVAATAIAKSIIELIHSPEAGPGNLKYKDARDDASLQALAASPVFGVVQGKVGALKHHIGEAQSGVSQVSEKTKAFWAAKLVFWENQLAVLEASGKSLDALSDAEKQARTEFLETGRKAWEVDLPKVLVKLSTEMVGPYALGDQFSIADLPLAAWFTRLAVLSGAVAGDDGKTVVDKIEQKAGIGAFLPRDYSADVVRRSDKVAKLGVFWDGLKTRRSWQKIYGEGLF